MDDQERQRKINEVYRRYGRVLRVWDLSGRIAAYVFMGSWVLLLIWLVAALMFGWWE